jgi:hypothetical protein
MTNQAQRFIELHTRAFPGVPVPPLPRHPGELALSVQMALRDADAGWWQHQFGGRDDRGEQARLPADVEQRMLAGTPYPEDEGALRAANMDFYANAAAAQRQQIIDRAREATRAREKEQYEAEVARFKHFREGSLLERLAASPVSAEAAAAARAEWGLSG